PSKSTRSPRHSPRINRTDSRNRANRSLNSGQSPWYPVAISFSASPVPTPKKIRSGYRQAMVAKACATTAGLYRNVGVSTEVPNVIRLVRSPTAVIQASENGACPPSCRHGWKWSLTVALSMPCASALTASSTSSRGANCSADALYPSLSSATRSFYSFPRLYKRPRPATPGFAALAITPRLAGMAPAPTLVQVTDTVHLAQGEAVNWTLVTDSSGVLLIDAGYPGDRADVLASLRALGYGPGDVRAILLTHAHIDHLGSAIWFAVEHGTPVYCHAAEVGHAKREYLEQVSILDLALRIWRPTWAVWTAHVVRSGGLIRDGIPTTQPLTPDIAAALPGHPRPVFSPGHTGGHCSYLVDGVLASGDALITGHP